MHVDFGDNGNASDAAAAAAAGGVAPHVLIDATGARCPLFDSLGFSQQVALRWCSQRGVSFAVHSSSVEHLRQDLGSAALQLRPEELAELDALVDGPLLVPPQYLADGLQCAPPPVAGGARVGRWWVAVGRS